MRLPQSKVKSSMEHYARLLKYLAPYRGAVFLAVLFNLGVAALEGISIWVGAEFIERVLSGHHAIGASASPMLLISALDGLARTLLLRPTPFGTVLAGTATLVAARLMIGGLKIAKMVLIARVNQSILARIRNDLFERITCCDLAFSQKIRPGEVATIFIKDVDQLNEALFDAVDRALLHPIRLLLIIVLMLGQSAALTLWVFFFLVVCAAVVHFSGHRIQRLCNKALEQIGLLQGHLTEYLSSAMLARFMNRETEERSRFNRVSHDISDKLVHIVFMRNLAPQLVRGLFAVAGGGLLIMGGYQVFVQESLTAGALLKIVLLLPMAIFSIEALASLYVAQRVSMASARRVFSLLDLPAPVVDAPDAVTPAPFSKQIDLDHVGLVLDGKTILDDICFSIPIGTNLAIYGPSGAGKSTLLGLLTGIHRPSSGSIRIDGVDMARLKLGEWRKMLGVVPQDPVMVNGTVRENLKYGAPGADDSALEAVLDIVELGPRSGALLHGLDTPVGNRGELLSGGERQRLAIARALLSRPRILLMDEPTSMLDAGSKGKVIQAIERAARQRTLILITHDADTAAMADIRLKMANGGLVK